jgi:protein TonB
MPLRCLLFSSNEEMVQPIWQVLTDLGIEGEYCRTAVEAVEKVTTQAFQIVITDWEDQPEATFLLKTARDQKASQRPLTLAIVSDDSRLGEALQAGANSILVRPIRPEQVRDTMNTACQLLRSKQPSPPPPPAEVPAQSPVKEMAAAAAASHGTVLATASVPASQELEKTFRKGEFLQSPGSAPGAQFDTECEVQKSMDQVAASEVDALTELEPMASAVENAPAQVAEPRKALEGWATLQARLTKPDLSKADLNKPDLTGPPAPPPQNELLAYGEAPTFGSQPAPSTETASPQRESQNAESEAALFSYMSGESAPETHPAIAKAPKRIGAVLASALALVCLMLLALPRTRASLAAIYRNTAHAGRNWLNPQPVLVPQTVTQHETFGQDSNDYKFPVAENIPDATTDPSQIRVLPVIDPTAKPGKNTEAGSGQAAPSETGADPVPAAVPSEQPQVAQSQIPEPAVPSAGEVAGTAPIASNASASSDPVSTNTLPPRETPAPQPLRTVAVPSQTSAPSRGIQVATNAGIPSSLRSQLASSTPEASGNKPMEAAMSSIEPVNLPPSAALDLLAQPVDPIYPASAKASGQRGSVMLQILIGRDGTVQDAKFLQGSLAFARAAIDAVKQWRFKPYSLNGRAVSVQSTITLTFKPPA